MARAASKKPKSPAPPEGGQGGAARIVTQRMRLDELAPAPYNPRTISAGAMKGLSESVRRFGLVQPVIWNKRTGRVVGGHQRVKALESQGVVETDVVVVDLPELEEKALNLALNSPAISGEFTAEAMGILEEVSVGLPDVSAALLLPDLADLIRHDLKLGPPPLVTPPTPEPPAVPTTQPGDLIVLGRHRLLCGDAENVGHVARLLDGQTPFLMVTDPPYGVEYDPEWRVEAAAKGQLAYAASRVGVVTNDDRCDWRKAYRAFPGTVAYVWAPAGPTYCEFHEGLVDAGFEIRMELIWSKPHFPIGRGHYHVRHEPCLYAVRKGAAAGWVGPRNECTIWDIALDRNVEGGHSTQKPIECMARPMRNHDAPQVYDPFLGSGTTLIAAEQIERACFGMEISPAYCDVIVHRWEALTGQKAVRP